MSKKNSLDFDLGAISKAMEGMQDAYAQGLGAINAASDQVGKDMNPSHRITTDVQLSANVQNHEYKVDAHLEFVADLDQIINSQSGDIASLLGGLGVDLSAAESSQVIDQLGKPRCIAVLDKYEINKLVLFGKTGRIKKGINPKATMLITLDNKKLHLSFESVFALPQKQSKQEIYNVIPSQEKMQQHVVIPIDRLSIPKSFKWKETDKDNLRILGKVRIEKI